MNRRFRKIPVRALTPGIRAELAAYLRRANGRGLFSWAEDAERREVEAGVFRFQTLLVLPGLLVAYGGTSGVFEFLESGTVSTLPVFAFVLGLLILVVMRRFDPTGSSPSAAFLAGALPHLRLSEADRRLATALVESADIEGLGNERFALLRRFSEEDARLRELAARLGEDEMPEIAREREAIRRELDGVSDPHARETLTRSLAFLDARSATAEASRPLRERLSAHRTMLDQAGRAVAAGEPASVDVATTIEAPALFERVADLGAEVAALESARREMRAL